MVYGPIRRPNRESKISCVACSRDRFMTGAYGRRHARNPRLAKDGRTFKRGCRNVRRGEGGIQAVNLPGTSRGRTHARLRGETHHHPRLSDGGCRFRQPGIVGDQVIGHRDRAFRETATRFATRRTENTTFSPRNSRILCRFKS